MSHLTQYAPGFYTFPENGVSTMTGPSINPKIGGTGTVTPPPAPAPTPPPEPDPDTGKVG